MTLIEIHNQRLDDQEIIIRKETAISSHVILTQSVTGNYSFTFQSPSGQLLLTSPSFTEKAIALSRIAMTCCMARRDRNREICYTGDGQFYFVVKSNKGELLGQSELFADERSLQNGINSLKSCTHGSRLLDLTKPDEKALSSKKVESARTNQKRSATSSRIILTQSVTGQYSYTFRATDGQLLLTSPFFNEKAVALSRLTLTRGHAQMDQFYHIRSAGGGQCYFELKNDKGEMLGRSTVYADGQSVQKGIHSLKSCAEGSRLLDLTISE